MENEKKLYVESGFHAWVRTGLIAVIAAAVVLTALKLNAAVTRLEADAANLETQAEALIGEADRTLVTIGGAAEELEGIAKTVGEADVSGIMTNLDTVIGTIEKADLASVINDLHDAVENLNSVMEPLAKFFNRF